MSQRYEPDGLSVDLRDVARGGLFSVVGAVVSALFGFLLVVVVTRGLHTLGSGVFFTSVALFTIVSNIGELGADTGLVRMVSHYRANGRIDDLRPVITAALVPVLAACVVLAALMFVFAPLLSHTFMRGAHGDAGVVYLRVMAPFVPLAAASTVALAGTRGFASVVPVVLINSIGRPVSRVLLAALVIGLGAGSLAVAVSWSLPFAVAFVLGVLILYRQLRRAERTLGRRARYPRPFPKVAGEFWRFAAPRGLAAVFEITILWLNVLMVGALASARDAGIYAAASKFVTTGTFVLEASRLVVAPRISALLARRRERHAEELMQTATGWVIAASWPIYLVLAAFAPVVLRIYGRDFVAGGVALTVMSLAVLVNLGTGNVQTVLLMAGRSSWNLWNMVAALAINFGLGLLLIPRHGVTGAAIAWSAGMIFDNAASVVEVRVLLGLRTVGARSLLVGLAAAACYGLLGLAGRVVLGASLPSLILFGVLGTACYGLLLWRLRDRLRLGVLRQSLPPSRRAGRHVQHRRPPAHVRQDMRDEVVHRP